VRLERALRAAAVLIALAAAIDPEWSRSAPVRPRVVVQHAAGADRGLAAQVADVLAADFEVSRADETGASAYVIAGVDVPDGWQPPEGAIVFAVTPAAAPAGVRIVSIDGAPEVSIDSVSPLRAVLDVAGSGTRDVTLTLSVDGVRRQELVAHVAGADARAVVPLAFVPSRLGLARVRVDAQVAGGAAASAEIAIDVTDRVWRVLVFDGRPTYASTFVRRALEADSRFDVVAHSVTSRGMAVRSGAAPVSLEGANTLSEFDLVIIGAPETLGAREATLLDRYLRARHGAVVLLPEGSGGELVPGLTGIAAWRDERRPAAVKLAAGENAWTASEFLWPARWPALVTSLATADGTGNTQAPVWQIPVGGGRLVVSSAIDGWRSRADAASGYSAFWRLTAAMAASATPPLVHVRLDERLVTPGAPVVVDVQNLAITGTGVGPGGVWTAEVVDVTGGASPVRLWPGESAQRWRGTFRAPDVPGRYRLRVTGASGAANTVEFLVDDAARVRGASEGNGLASLAAATHGGATIAAERLGALPAQLGQALTPTTVPQPWYPMRSVWWLAPFTIAASGEWWLRRRRGRL
jgi:hypothetical protein